MIQLYTSTVYFGIDTVGADAACMPAYTQNITLTSNKQTLI